MQQAAQSPVKERIFRIAVDTAIAYSRALDDGGPPMQLRLRHAVSDKLVYGKLRAAVGGQVRYAVSGGAALGERLGHFFRGVGITILEGYGLTETSPAATVNRPNRNKIGTVGLPLPGVAVRIADDGEILIRGAIVFVGYWHNDAATAEVIDESGWFHTGDIGELDDEGFLRITGRKKELIVTAAGKNVAPALLEDRIRAHRADQPVHRRRRRQALYRLPADPGRGGTCALEGAARQTGRCDRRQPQGRSRSRSRDPGRYR